MPGHLTDTMLDAAAGLPGVTTRRMFGCDALFVNGNIFAVEWAGRLGVRLPDEADFARLLATPGAGKWDPMGGTKGMAHWVLVPEDFLDEPATLREWVARAHALNAALPAKGATKKSPPKKATRKK